MKQVLFFVFFVCSNLFLHATMLKTVSISAGGLSTALTATEKTSITELTITGTIDARDVKIIRDNITNLTVLNISATTINSYTGTAGTDVLSTTYPANELPKNSFRKSDFTGKSTLKTVILPGSITSIGDKAFEGCIGITGLTMPETVKTIGLFTFYGCSGLTTIKIPNAVTSIGSNAFTGCTRLTSIILSNKITSIGDWTFASCVSLNNITIPNTVTSIGNYAFLGCGELTSLTIPTSVKTIGESAFSSCIKLTSITIPSLITSIGNGAFSNCSGLSSITIPNSLTTIGDWAFLGCNKLTKVSIPNTVTTIGYGAFYDCSGLISINVNVITPVILSSTVFTSVNKDDCTLIVPVDSKSAYEVASVWKDFFKIVETEPVVTDIIDHTKVEITFYPNPVTDGFEFNGLEGNGMLTLTDFSGKIMLKKQVVANEFISVDFLTQGVYILKLVSDKATFKSKLMKN